MAGLKENSKRVLDIIATQEKRNAKAAYKQVHPDASDITAAVNAYQLLAKPAAQLYLESHINKAKETIVGLMDSDKPDIQLRAATDVLDRSQGKAVQQILSVSVTVAFSNVPATA
jgi:hypothetical protein